jgi:hypothetical protein
MPQNNLAVYSLTGAIIENAEGIGAYRGLVECYESVQGNASDNELVRGVEPPRG